MIIVARRRPQWRPPATGLADCHDSARQATVTSGQGPLSPPAAATGHGASGGGGGVSRNSRRRRGIGKLHVAGARAAAIFASVGHVTGESVISLAAVVGAAAAAASDWRQMIWPHLGPPSLGAFCARRVQGFPRRCQAQPARCALASVSGRGRGRGGHVSGGSGFRRFSRKFYYPARI